MTKFSLLLALIGLLFTALQPVRAQQCGVAERVQYPVDTRRFQLAQDFEPPTPDTVIGWLVL